MEETEMIIDPSPGLFPPDHVSQTTDCWTRAGSAWARHQVTPRVKLFKPTFMPDGPDVEKLEYRRITQQ
eukprot:8376504-Lingulodinium_polyedra.AAC.1